MPHPGPVVTVARGMAEFRVVVDLSSLFPRDGLFGGAAFDAAHFPALQEAVREAAEAGRARWRAYATGAPLPEGHAVPDRHQKPYGTSIGLRQIGDFEAEVFTDYAHAEVLDAGEPARDLKEMLDRSRKVRMGKRGRYLIIPFRWTQPKQNGQAATFGPNEMDHEVRGWWRGKTRSVRYGQGDYDWGARFKAADARKLGMDVDTPGKARNQVNMYAFRKRGATGGAAANASFMTFRTMGSWQSDKWIVPAKPPLRIAETVAREVRAEAEASFKAAAAEDLGNLVGAGRGGGGSIRRIPGLRRR